MKFGLEEKVINKINSEFKKFPEVEEVIIYGSRAKGNYKTGSALKGKKITNELLSEVNICIEELNTPYLFDVSLYQALNSSDLKDYINRIGKIFYEKNDQLDKEEKEILEAYENGKLNEAPISDSMVLAAKEALKKQE